MSYWHQRVLVTRVRWRLHREVQPQVAREWIPRKFEFAATSALSLLPQHKKVEHKTACVPPKPLRFSPCAFLGQERTSGDVSGLFVYLSRFFFRLRQENQNLIKFV
ncbi:hypothetical protein ACLOJK_013488 [Asimina triloba]